MKSHSSLRVFGAKKMAYTPIYSPFRHLAFQPLKIAQLYNLRVMMMGTEHGNAAVIRAPAFVFMLLQQEIPFSSTFTRTSMQRTPWRKE